MCSRQLAIYRASVYLFESRMNLLIKRIHQAAGDKNLSPAACYKQWWVNDKDEIMSIKKACFIEDTAHQEVRELVASNYQVILTIPKYRRCPSNLQYPPN